LSSKARGIADSVQPFDFAPPTKTFEGRQGKPFDIAQGKRTAYSKKAVLISEISG
jgi:hypothetical protein